MRSIPIIVGLALSLTATPVMAKESRNYWIGYIVTYVELCGHFRGHTIDHLRVRDITAAFEDDKDFQRGYRRQRGLLNAADRLYGLRKCDDMFGYFAKIDLEGQLALNAKVAEYSAQIAEITDPPLEVTSDGRKSIDQRLQELESLEPTEGLRRY